MSVPVPAFSTANLPGGPWRTFIRRARISAVRVLGHFTFTDDTGVTTDYPNGGWVALMANGTVQVVDPDTFSGTYDNE